MKLPTTMRASTMERPGGPHVLRVIDVPIPTISEGQVLIEVEAAGVNRPDCLQREGKYPPPKGASDILGLEVAGRIVSIGERVENFTEGDQVMALVTGGGYAQYVVAEENCLLTIPDSLTIEEAAAIPETFFTVWHNVFQRGGLIKDETLLVHGGTSGIGTTAIQLAKNFGARVITTVGSQEKRNVCLELGADCVIIYRDEDFVDKTLEFTDGKGADVILDMVGGDYISRNYQAAAMEGRIVQIAFLNGPKTQIDVMPLMLKRLIHTGSTLRARSAEFKNNIARELEINVWPLIEKAGVRPVIDKIFELEDVVAAHHRIEDSGHIGKIVLRIK